MNVVPEHFSEDHLLDVLELFHYSYHFRGSVFSLVISDENSFLEILTDLRVLQVSHIDLLIIAQDSHKLKSSVQKLSKRGMRFFYLPIEEPLEPSSKIIEEARNHLLSGDVPVLAVKDDSMGHASPATLQNMALEISRFFNSEKLFFLSSTAGLSLDGNYCSHISSKELQSIIKGSHELNVKRDFLGFLLNANTELGIDIVLLEAVSGSLFREIFTHAGSGTLITDDYPNVIRKARLEDVFDISRLMRPSVEEGLILPLTEDDIADRIKSFYVYSVNDAIVAASQLKDYDSAAALAKFCTLPRYQGKGRAKQLARAMIEQARAEGKDYVFSVSISPPMWTFFQSLGLCEIDRANLPQSWQNGYDFNRPSKAFKLELH